MDDADLAQEIEQSLVNGALNNRKSTLTSPDVKCIWCKDDPVVPKYAFCSAERGEDYFKHERKRKQRITGD
ncbi:TraR/DksA C4-type zinc finger protein [Pantoea ananatis]